MALYCSLVFTMALLLAQLEDTRLLRLDIEVHLLGGGELLLVLILLPLERRAVLLQAGFDQLLAGGDVLHFAIQQAQAPVAILKDKQTFDRGQGTGLFGVGIHSRTLAAARTAVNRPPDAV
jgi:hypothetical protein